MVYGHHSDGRAMTQNTDTYGRVKFVTIQKTKNELRRAIQSEGTPLIQDIWDRLEQRIDSPLMQSKKDDRP
jgi:hypothetical protein